MFLLQLSQFYIYQWSHLSNKYQLLSDSPHTVHGSSLSNMEISTQYNLSANKSVYGDLKTYTMLSPGTSIPFVMTAPLYSVIFTLGVLGNALVLGVVLKSQGKRTRTNIFLVNLSVSSMFLAIFCLPFLVVESFLQSQWIFGNTGCKYILMNFLL